MGSVFMVDVMAQRIRLAFVMLVTSLLFSFRFVSFRYILLAN